MSQKNNRIANEIAHGKHLASGKAEFVWGWSSPAGQERSKKRAAKLIEAAKLQSGKKVLEIGSGTGVFTRMFAITGAEITSNDLSEELILLARENNPSINFILGRYENLTMSNPFDSVVGSSVLHHLELEEALEKTMQLLKPGGRIAFAEPNMLNPQVFAERTFLRNALDYVSPDETAFVRWQLAKTLTKHGFVDIQITPFDWLHPAIPTPLISTVETIGKVLEKLPIIREFSGSLLISAQKPGPTQ